MVSDKINEVEDLTKRIQELQLKYISIVHEDATKNALELLHQRLCVLERVEINEVKYYLNNP